MKEILKNIITWAKIFTWSCAPVAAIGGVIGFCCVSCNQVPQANFTYDKAYIEGWYGANDTNIIKLYSEGITVKIKSWDISDGIYILTLENDDIIAVAAERCILIYEENKKEEFKTTI